MPTIYSKFLIVAKVLGDFTAQVCSAFVAMFHKTYNIFCFGQCAQRLLSVADGVISNHFIQLNSCDLKNYFALLTNNTQPKVSLITI